MSGVQNDYNQAEGDPRIRVGNWVEERALMASTGQSRGSFIPPSRADRARNHIDTTTRITGSVFDARDYGTTTNLAQERVLRATEGPAFVESIAQPRRAQSREAARAALAAQLVEDRRREEEAAAAAEIRATTYGSRGSMNRSRVLQSDRSVEDAANSNPIMGTAISFHTHHLGAIHGATPSNNGVHTFSKDTSFSKPIGERWELHAP